MDYHLVATTLANRLNDVQQQIGSEKCSFNKNENAQNILIEHEVSLIVSFIANTLYEKNFGPFKW